MTLNSEFLKDLDKSKMELMTTNVGIDGQSRTTEDYVRFITKEEAEKLPVEILESDYEYGYWTMSAVLLLLGLCLRVQRLWCR
ncbi:MAG: hypothetical protein V8R01_06430 [Bacilli bacterium]